MTTTSISGGHSRVGVVTAAVLLLVLSDVITINVEASRVLLISLDGFRYDYLDIARQFGWQTPTFDQLLREGVSVRSPGITNAFCTKTFPSQYLIVTGLYQETHGVIANSFYDPVFDEYFNPSATDIKWWNGTGDYAVVPIWVTNEQTPGNNRTSGVVSWLGSEVEGQQPHFFIPYDKSFPLDSRVDLIVSWFTDEQRPINFGVLYFEEPDGTGHNYGPNSTNVAQKVAELDLSIKRMLDILQSESLLEDMNIILTSDHGMQSLHKVVHLSDYSNTSLYTVYGGSPAWHVMPKPGYEETVYEQLRSVPNATVYRKEEIPDRWHYRDNRRIGSILLVADAGVFLCVDNSGSYWCFDRGDHGYDNALPSMHPIFIARGPAFKTNFVAEPFESVDIYPLLCHLLEMEPRLNNGSFDRIKHILKDVDNFDERNMAFRDRLSVWLSLLPYVATLLLITTFSHKVEL